MKYVAITPVENGYVLSIMDNGTTVQTRVAATIAKASYEARELLQRIKDDEAQYTLIAEDQPHASVGLR